jgi:hypothetical protein
MYVCMYMSKTVTCCLCRWPRRAPGPGACTAVSLLAGTSSGTVAAGKARWIPSPHGLSRAPMDQRSSAQWFDEVRDRMHWCKFATVPACSSRDQLADTGWNMAGTVADTGWYMLILRLEQADAG